MINEGLDVKTNQSAILYHYIRIFINLQQGENDPNDNFKLRWDNVYETTELAGIENILRSNQIIKVDGYQASYKKKQVQVDKIKAIFFLLRSDQKRYSFLLKQLRDRDNVGRDEYPFMIKSALDLLIRNEGRILRNQKYSTYENWGG